MELAEKGDSVNIDIMSGTFTQKTEDSKDVPDI